MYQHRNWREHRLKWCGIPAGEFQMGSNQITEAIPRHTLYLDEFYIDPV